MRRLVRVLTGLLSSERRVVTLEEMTAFALARRPQAWRERHLERAPTLPAESLASARLYSDREAMLHALPKGGVVGEVGTWRGEFSAKIVKICKPDTFHLFDLDFAPLVEPAGNNVKHLGDSVTLLRRMPTGSFDWLYIDADHSYAGVVRDLEAAHLAVKPGGYLMCNDYTNWCGPHVTPYGVARAVNKFIIKHGYAVKGLALHSAGMNDLLIRRP